MIYTLPTGIPIVAFCGVYLMDSPTEAEAGFGVRLNEYNQLP